MFSFIRMSIFLLVSAYFIWLSRASLIRVKSHGFYRFFAWEVVLILVLLNVDHWFTDYFSGRQIISWLLLSIATYMAAAGAITLYKSGGPKKDRDDPTLIGLEKTTKLVQTGIYRFIRHPLYGSIVIGVWGVALKEPDLISFALAMAAVVLMTVTARIEELENIRYFGQAYRDYMKKTRMFIPYLF